MNLFVGDSLGLPVLQSVTYEKTTPYHLAKSGESVWLAAFPGATVSMLRDILISFSECLPEKFFNMTVIQLGLADCAPRPIDMQWRNKLSSLKIKWLKRRIIRFLHNHRAFIQKHFGYFQKTNFATFQHDFEVLLKLSLVLAKKTAVILMPPITDNHETHSPGIRKENIRYNKCMKDLATRYSIPVVDCVDELKSNLLYNVSRDGHLTMDGFQIIRRELDEVSV